MSIKDGGPAITVAMLSEFDPALKWTELFGTHSTRTNKITWNVSPHVITRTQDTSPANMIQCIGIHPDPVAMMRAINEAANTLNTMLRAREAGQ